jgi:archaellum component FlaC
VKLLTGIISLLRERASSEHEWVSFLRRLVDSVKDITGVCPEVQEDIATLSSTKLDELVKQLEKLEKEVRTFIRVQYRAN